MATVVLGWAFARDVPRALGPILLRHMDPSVAGTVGFLIRLMTVAVTAIIAAGFAGENLRGLLVGGAFTAVIVGLAAQQTLGNLIAGSVLLTARPFRVGERVRLQGAPGRIEGLVSTVGLLYTSFSDGDERVMVPNSVVLNSALTPLREPDSVTLRARLRAGTKPGDLQRLIEGAVTTPLRSSPSVTLLELDGDEVDRPDIGDADAARMTGPSSPASCSRSSPGRRRRRPTRRMSTGASTAHRPRRRRPSNPRMVTGLSRADPKPLRGLDNAHTDGSRARAGRPTPAGSRPTGRRRS